MKRRFGFDLLLPISRYVLGLTEPTIYARHGDIVDNPIFSAEPGQPRRDPSQVFLAGIVGVPWQDVADQESLEDPARLRYLSYAELVEQDRWSWILGENGERPRDGLMIETPLDRATLAFDPHPATGEPLAPASSEDPSENSINGHESLVSDSDLQRACTFPIEPRVCDDNANGSCDCQDGTDVYNRALCQPPEGGPSGNVQYYAGAYPAGRQLELLRDFGKLTGNSIVTSICPKVLDQGLDSYGYNPAVLALADRMKAGLAPICLAEPLPVDSAGRVACSMLEVSTFTDSMPCAACQGLGRVQVAAGRAQELRGQLEALGFCRDDGPPWCEQVCLCEIEQVAGDNLERCQYGASTPGDFGGFCYVDEEKGIGDPSIVASCPAGRKRMLRVAGGGIPASGSNLYLACAER